MKVPSQANGCAEGKCSHSGYSRKSLLSITFDECSGWQKAPARLRLVPIPVHLWLAPFLTVLCVSFRQKISLGAWQGDPLNSSTLQTLSIRKKKTKPKNNEREKTYKYIMAINHWVIQLFISMQTPCIYSKREKTKKDYFS